MQTESLRTLAAKALFALTPRDERNRKPVPPLPALKPIALDEAGDKANSTAWISVAREHAGWLGALSADQIPSDRKWFMRKGAELAAMHKLATTDVGEQIEYVKHVLLCSVGAALVRAGWNIDTAPGRPVSVVKGNNRFQPHVPIAQLADASMNLEYWKTQCASLGITGMPLAPSPAAESRIA